VFKKFLKKPFILKKVLLDSNMTYFIKLTDDTNEELMFDSNILGNESFGTFYAERGMKSLMHILENHPEVIESTKIVTDTGIQFTITEFIDRLNKLKVLFN
tara:strand:- start:216 stop:518 length:303 start_codon:yes stop_codon:yes gene_type:complete